MSGTLLRLLLPMLAAIFAAVAVVRVLLATTAPPGTSLPSWPFIAAMAAGGLVAWALAAWLAARLRHASREIGSLVDSIATGHAPPRAPRIRSGELGEVAHSIGQMAQQLRLRIDAATAEKERLEAVVASMVEGVIVLDAAGRVVLANPRLRELLDTWGEVEGRHPLEMIRNTEIDRALAEATESDEIVAREIERVGPEERTLRIHATGFPADGPRAGTVAVFHDVSELRRLEQVRRDFIANASHELRTPLTSIQGFADTLIGGGFSPRDARGPLEAIVRNAERLGALIEDLLELSRIESRRVPLRPSEVDVSRVCSVLIEDARPRLRESQLIAQADVGLGVSAWVDQGALVQAVTNLLDNAIKYTEAGGHISLEVIDRGERIEVAVGDDGVGISEAEQTRIFERFYRVDKARSRALGGTGLGLAIVKHLAQAMDSDITVESRPGEGSRFVLSLPATREHPSSAVAAG